MKLHELQESWVDRFHDQWNQLRWDEDKTVKDLQHILLQHGIFMPIDSGFVKKYLPPQGHDVQGAAHMHLEAIPANIKMPEIRAAKRLGAKQLLVVNFPSHVYKSTLLVSLSDRFWSTLRHELTHSQQPPTAMSTDDYHDPDRQPIKMLRYMVQPAERGPHALDIASELATIDKTPKDVQVFIQQQIAHFDEENDLSYPRWFQEIGSAFGGSLSKTPQLYQFLASYMIFKYDLQFPPPHVTQEFSQNDFAKFDAQSKALMKLIAKHFKKIHGYQY